MLMSMLNPSVLMAPAGDADGGGGGDGDKDPPAKEYTKAEVEKMVVDRLKKATRTEAKLTKQVDDLTAAATKNTEALEKLQAQIDGAGGDKKSDAEKALEKLTRQVAKQEADMAKLTGERDEAVTLRDQAVTGLSTTKLRAAVRDGLQKSKAHATGMEQAVTLMLESGDVKFNEEGEFTATVGGVPFDKADEAGKKWLEANPHFLEGNGGGSGSPRPGGTAKLIKPEVMAGMSSGALIHAGLKSKPATG